jgi:ubiquinone biosynthesis protein COQ9
MATCARVIRARPHALLRRPLRASTTTTTSQPRCLFHSHDHPPPPGPFTEVESAILSAAYKHVPEHGFTTRALGLGAKDAGYRDISPSVLTDGAFGLIRWHLVTQRNGLKGRVVKAIEGGGPVESKVERVTWERLLANKDVIHRWQEVRTMSILVFTKREHTDSNKNRLSRSWLSQAMSLSPSAN